MKAITPKAALENYKKNTQEIINKHVLELNKILSYKYDGSSLLLDIAYFGVLLTTRTEVKKVFEKGGWNIKDVGNCLYEISEKI